jgi:hypothetical protein
VVRNRQKHRRTSALASVAVTLRVTTHPRAKCAATGRVPSPFQAAQTVGRAIGAGLFAITPAGERGMCCKAIKLGNARVFPVTTL